MSCQSVRDGYEWSRAVVKVIYIWLCKCYVVMQLHEKGILNYYVMDDSLK